MVYVTDSLYYRNKGMGITRKWYDMLHPKFEDEDAETIIADVVAKTGIEVLRHESTGTSD